jgi:hypothetical protein
LKKWEYRVIDLIKETKSHRDRRKNASQYWLKKSDLEEVLTKLGSQGWELINVHFLLDTSGELVVAFFKRSL